MQNRTILRKWIALILIACCMLSMAAAETAEPQAYIKLSWEAQSIGEELDIVAYVTGIMDDGGDVLPAETEGEYFNSTDGSWLGSHYIYGNGFTFKSYNAHDMLNTVWRALTGYADKQGWATLRERGMRCDNSWGTSANKYIRLYKEITKV